MRLCKVISSAVTGRAPTPCDKVVGLYDMEGVGMDPTADWDAMLVYKKWLTTLRPRVRGIVEATIAGFSYAEIGKHLGEHRTTVRRALVKAHKEFKAYISGKMY